MMSNQAIRDYNKIFNQIDNMRAGSRGMTQAALDRIRKELPPVQMLLINPQAFMDQFRTARNDWYDVLANRTHADSKAYKIDPYITDQIAALAPKGVALPGTDPSKVDVDEGMASGIKANMVKLMKAGHTKEEARVIIMKQYGLNPAPPAAATPTAEEEDTADLNDANP
jgi:hypothetical protein